MFSAFAEQLVNLKKIVLSLKSGVLDIFHVLRVLFSKLLFQICLYHFSDDVSFHNLVK
jgi:hypothetical protein